MASVAQRMGETINAKNPATAAPPIVACNGLVGTESPQTCAWRILIYREIEGGFVRSTMSYARFVHSHRPDLRKKWIQQPFGKQLLSCGEFLQTIFVM
jgi:hypothetical protein